MKYNKSVVTVAGSSFLATAVSNKKAPILDKLIILNTDIPANKTLESLTIQDFSNGKQYDINNVSQNDNAFTATSVVTNDGLTADYPAKLIGLTGYIDGSDRILIAVSQADDPFIIEKQTDTLIKLVPSITVGFNNTTDINITVKSDVYIVKSELDKMLASMGYSTIEYVNNKFAGIDLRSSIKESENYTDGKINDFKNNDEDINAVKNFTKGVKISGNSLYVNDDKLMYRDKPVLIANAPNAPTIDLSINRDTGNVEYQIYPPKIDGGASVTSYTLFYKKDSDNDFTNVKLNQDNLIGQINSEKGSQYQFKVKATNFAGDGFESETKSILSATEPKGVTISLENKYPDGIKYTVSVSDDGHSKVTGYQVFYKKENDTDWNLIQTDNDSGYISDLGENNDYQVKAKAKNIVGLSDIGDITTINYFDERIFGVSWDRSSNSQLTRTDSAVGMVAGINGNSNDFDNTGIWGKMKRVTDSYGNVFVRIPKFYIKKTQSTGLLTWQASLVKWDSSWYLPKCFYSFDKNSENQYVDVGAYLGNIVNGKLVSKTGQSPSTNYFMFDMRQYAKNNGNGYHQLDIHVWDILQTLFTIEFATLDSQSIMYGTTTNMQSGRTDNMNGVSASDNVNFKYRGIESMYCNMGQFLDGIGINVNTIYVCDDAREYASGKFTYPYKTVSYSMPIASSGSITSIGFDSTNPEVTIATSIAQLGSNTPFKSDYMSIGSRYSTMLVVGNAGYGMRASLWGINASYDTSTTSGIWTGRLIKKENY